MKKLTGTERQEGEQKSLRRVGCGDISAGTKGLVLRTMAGSKLHVSPALPSVMFSQQAQGSASLISVDIETRILAIKRVYFVYRLVEICVFVHM